MGRKHQQGQTLITTVPYMLENTLEKYAGKEALFSGESSFTFGELYRQAQATAHILRELGFEKGDRVGIYMNKTLNQAISILGTLYSNAVFVPILPKLKEANIRHIINDCQMAALITDSTRIDEVAQYADDVKLLVGNGRVDVPYPSLPELRPQMDHLNGSFSCIGSDNAAIIYSSGSTGRPKGIVISHRNLSDGARIVSTYLKTTSEDRICGVLSLDFDYGLNQLWQTIYKGSSLYLHEFAFPNDLFQLVSSARLTALPLMPVIVSRMFDPRFYVPSQGHDFSALRYICSSGGSVAQKMLSNLRAVFPGVDIVLMYGLTEAFRSTYLPPDQVSLRPTSIGKAIPDAEMYVMDDDYNLCPPETPGILVHRGGCISKGYWNDPERTSQVFRQIPMFPGETVVFSGDLVKTDEDGYLYFISRLDSMIKTRGYRVSPTEIEEEATRLDKVAEAVASGVVNVEVGADILLAYTSTDGQPVDSDTLSRHMKMALPNHMVPRYYAHMVEFPSTGNQGKIDRVAVENEATKRLGLR